MIKLLVKIFLPVVIPTTIWAISRHIIDSQDCKVLWESIGSCRSESFNHPGIKYLLWVGRYIGEIMMYTGAMTTALMAFCHALEKEGSEPKKIIKAKKPKKVRKKTSKFTSNM